MSKLSVLIVIICLFQFQLLIAQNIQIPPETQPNIDNWNDLFAPDLSNAIFDSGGLGMLAWKTCGIPS